MDDLDGPPIREPLVPVAGRIDRRPIVAVLALALVVLAIAVPKPWSPSRPSMAVPTQAPGASVGGGAGPGGSGGAGGSPAPAATSDPYEPLRTICGSPGGWRAATLHRWPEREAPIRTWSAIEPGEAAAADDPDVPFVDVVAAVATLGYCSPRGEDSAPEDTTAEIWLVGEGGAPPRRLDAELAEPDAPHPLGGFWAPPPEARAEVLGVEAWRPGRYAIRLSGTRFDRWIGIEIREPPGPDDDGPTRTPRPEPASAAPSGT